MIGISLPTADDIESMIRELEDQPSTPDTEEALAKLRDHLADLRDNP